MALPTPLLKYRQIYLQPPIHCAGYSNLCKNTKTTNYCRGVGSSEWQGATEGDWEHPSSSSSTASHQQSHQPQTAPTQIKTSAIYLGVTFTSSRSSTVRTPDLKTSWMPQRNSTKTFANFPKEPPLLSTSSFWVWAAPSTALTL